MKCLYCNKEITSSSNKNSLWHDSCIKKFFGTPSFPELGLTKETIEEYASRNVNEGLTVPGVQKKMSLHLSKEDNPRLTLIGEPTGYIIKFQSDVYSFLPEAEHLVMSLARESKISTVPFALVNVPSDNNRFAFITKRIDRENGQMLAMEDFCQLSGKLTEDKYKGSVERCGKIIKDFSSKVGLDLSEFFLRVVFSFVMGNSDMHLKNYSLIEPTPGSDRYELSKAYDLLPVNICHPADKEESALSINGKKTNIRYKDFMALASNIGLKENVARNIIKKVVLLEETYIKMIDEYPFLPKSFKDSFICLLKERTKRLTKD
ncbi:MAG: HipA domain-containing protein [Bacilli bacterium]|nr:HipA domain-containing protein [Bacilli bacterium]